MTQTISYICSDCGDDVEVERGGEMTNQYDELICESCPETPPWETVEFPLWVEFESYNDTWGMLRRVSERTGVPEEDIPAGEMKYTVFAVWYKIEEDGSVHGPYDEKRGEEI